MKNKIEIFKEKGSLKHDNKYDYSFVSFTKLKDKIKINCPIHGEFEQRVDVHLKGEGCKKCYLNERGINDRLSTEDFILKIKLIHGDKYNYENTIYIKNSELLTINCPIHGNFNQIAGSHLNGAGCPICKESKGEREIRLLLEKNNIKFIIQHKFQDCKYKRQLPFDFYLPNFNICIEYHGIQHYEPIPHFGGYNRLEKQKRNDNIKMEYCQNNNIPLIVIKYNESIEDKLKPLS